MVNLINVEKNRRHIIEQAITNHAFNIYTYAKFFETKTSVLERDIQQIFGKDFKYENNTEISLNDLKAKREQDFTQLQEQGKTEDECLERYGMWHQPIDIKPISSLLVEITNEVKPKLIQQSFYDAALQYKASPNEENLSRLIAEGEKEIPNLSECLESLQLGLNRTEVKSIYQLTGPQSTRLSYLTQAMNGIQQTVDRQFLQYEDIQEAVRSFQGQVNVVKISRITGITNDNLCRILNNQYEEYLDKSQQYQSKIKDRQQQVWDLYNKYGTTHGYTQQEIADMLHITRHTVISDLIAYKLDHPDEIDQTQLYQPRHAGKDKYLSREDKISKVKFGYDLLDDINLSMSAKISKISKLILMNQDDVRQILIEDGKINPYEDYPTTEELAEDILDYATVGLNSKGQFSHGATRKILESQHFITPEDREKERYKILRNQKRTMAVLRTKPEIKPLLDENNLSEVIEVLEQDISPIKRAQKQNEELTIEKD